MKNDNLTIFELYIVFYMINLKINIYIYNIKSKFEVK